MHHFKTPVILKYNGLVTWYAPATVKTSCRVDAKNYPFDQQNCSLVLGSWTYNGLEIDIYPSAGSADTSMFQERGDFDLISVKSRRKVNNFA